MGSDYSTNATSYIGASQQVPGISSGQVVMPYQMTAPYPCDEFVSSKKKSHTGLIATVLGLMAAGGAIYAFKGKSAGAQKIVTAAENFCKDAGEGFKKLYHDIVDWVKGKTGSTAGGKGAEASNAVRAKIPEKYLAKLTKLESETSNPALKAIEDEMTGIIKPAGEGAKSAIPNETLKKIGALAENGEVKLADINLDAVRTRIQELEGNPDADKAELEALKRLEKLLTGRSTVQGYVTKLENNLASEMSEGDKDNQVRGTAGQIENLLKELGLKLQPTEPKA